jgi:Fe/S biogenesis protein NfuA
MHLSWPGWPLTLRGGTVVTFTEVARKKILELLGAQDRPDLALRMAIRGRGPGGFQYSLAFVEPGEVAASDITFDGGGFKVYLDAESAPNLKGASVDFVDDLRGAGFKVDNPNALWTDPTALAVQKVIDESINPAVESHGGWITLLDVKDGVAYIQLGGGCQGCGMANVTLKQGVEVMIKEAVPQIREVIDSTDHAGGRNPYYRPAKGGQSPFQ